MPQNSDRTLSLTELFASIKRHRYLGALVFIAIFALAAIAWIVLPREYGSEGRMVVRMGRANLEMNTTPDSANMVSIQDTRETEIRSVIDLVKSEQVLGEVVDSIGADQILANTIKMPIIPVVSSLLASRSTTSVDDDEDAMTNEQYDALLQREKAIKQLRKELKVATEKKSANISVYSTAANPRLAQKVVNELMKVVQDTHVKVHSVNRSASHFESSLGITEAALKDCQKELEDFASQHNFLTIDDARTTLNGVIDKLENGLVDADLDLKTSLSMVSELEKQTKGIEVEFDMPTVGIERSATEGARQKYYERLGEKARLMAKYSPSHPKITQINTEIEQLSGEIDALPTERIQKDKVRNPVFEELTISLIKEMANAESKMQRVTQIHSMLEKKREQLKEYNRLKTESLELQRKTQLAQMEFDSYAKKRNESRMVDQLDKEAISDIVIQQPASLMLKKVAPKGSLLFPLGIFLGTVFGLASCIFADRKNLTNLTTPEEIEDAFGVPVLASLPRVHSSRVLIN